MGLGGVQDICGARFAFEDMPTLLSAASLLKEASLEGFELKVHYNYVKQPKESDYAASTSSTSTTPATITTATVVETAELISQSPLKITAVRQFHQACRMAGYTN